MNCLRIQLTEIQFEMENSIKRLSKEEYEEFSKINEQCRTQNQQEILKTCLDYYLDYREAVNNVPTDKIALAFKCAYFMGEKSQIMTDVSGKVSRGVALSLNKLLKEHKLDDTMLMLKEIYKKVAMDDDTRLYLNNVVKEISFLITFHTKLEKTLLKLDLKERTNEPCTHTSSSYSKVFQSFIWLLFIDSKNTILNKSTQILPNTYMLAHIISTMLILVWEYLRPEILKPKINENSNQKQIKLSITEKILQMFCIKDVQQYKEIAKLFEANFSDMMDRFSKGSLNKMDFFSPRHISANYNSLNKLYEKKIVPEELDERIFFRERALNLTPSKFTPFARQGYANKFHKPAIGGKLGSGIMNKDQHFSSHRILNYDNIQKQIDCKNTPAHEIKLPKSIMQSPSMVKVPLLCATPITAGMEMYNYLKQKAKLLNSSHSNERSIDKKVNSLIDAVFDLDQKNFDQKSKELKKEMILSLYKLVSEEYLAANSFERDTPGLMKAFLALSIQLIFFVSNISLSFQEIEEVLDIDSFEMWKAIDYFLKSDKAIPSPLKLHLLDLEVNLISFKIWRNKEMTKLLASIANRTHSNMNQAQYSIAEKLFKRTLHQIAFQITRLTTLLNVKETTAQFIFDTMKETLSSCSDMLYNRNIDQLIICTIFANCKADKCEIKFNEIRQCYEQSNPNLKAIVPDILCNIYTERDPPKDIIRFYNQDFIKTEQIKNFIISLRQSNQGRPAKNNSKKNPILMSPMKAIIPKQINFRAKNNKNLKGNVTPNTQLLVAYNESPFMKYDNQNIFKGPLKNKKVINYEQEEEKAKMNNKVCQEEVKTPETHEVTNTFFNKRFTGTNMGSRKIMQKENQNNGPMNSHRSLFDTTDKKETHSQPNSNVDQTKQRKNYPFSIYRS